MARKAEEPTATAATQSVSEPIYSAEQLAENHKVLNASKEIVIVALALAGKAEATVSEALKIVTKFKNEEVK